MEGSEGKRSRRGRRQARLLLVVLAVVGLPAAGAFAAFPQDPPNDPDYAPAEASLAACLTNSVNDDQYGLFSFMPRCAPAATDPENSSGDFTDQAWKQYSAGRGDVVIAYVEGGINWHLDDAKDLANKVYLNPGELPPPTTPDIGAKVCDPHALCAADYSDTQDYNGNGYVDPEDIIKRFSDGKDNDHNGYVDDISGWDFYDHQNDPATVDSTYGHANGQQRRAAAQTNNGLLGAGVCPRCMVMPVKAGAEALDRDTELAQAWQYAADHGASVIVSVTADLGYSSFMRQVVKQLWAKGVTLVQASNDFDSLDHQGGMFWPHVLPGNGLVSNTVSAKSSPADNAQTTSYRERSDYSSWGTHNMFSIATQGGTTSEDTPTLGGSMALVLSYGRDAAEQGKIARPLTGPEAVQVVRATASPVSDPTLAWPGKPGFNMQYGYGRPNLLKADQAVAANHIPPVGWLDSPEWYAQYDPTTTSSVPISGHVEARRSPSYTWKLQYALGPEPTEADWQTIGSGSGSAPFDGHLGTLDLHAIPASFYEAPFALSKTKTYETNDQYTVSLRVQVTDASGQAGEERRAIAVHHDPTLLPGFPKFIGPGGDAQSALGDLQGIGREAIVFGDSDGTVHAIDPRGGRELPGWPVHTNPVQVTLAHSGINPGHEPVISNVALGDLDHNGKLWVVATTLTGRVYVWDSHGHRRPGWPKLMNTGTQQPPIPRPAMAFTRLPVQGATAPPVLFDLEGKGALDVIQAAWDGHVYAWRPDGSNVPGWPVAVTLGPDAKPQVSGDSIVQDHKLDVAPAIAYLDSSGKPDVVVRSQYTEVPGAGLQPGGISHVFAYHADGTPVAGWPISNNSTVVYYGSAQEFLTEGVNAPIAGDVAGNGQDEIAAQAGIFSPALLYHGDGSPAGALSPAPNLAAALSPNPLNGVDAPVGFTTSGAFGKIGGGPLAYAQPMVGAVSTVHALLFAGSGTPIHNEAFASDAATGKPLTGYPATAQGLDFLSAPAIADVAGAGTGDVILGGDSSALQAYDGSGALVPGFPKFMSGWILWGPTVGDLMGDGHNDVVALTREGYLYAWSTPGKPGEGDQWMSYRHDEHNTARWGTDTRPPGVARNASLSADGRTLRFLAPGGNWYDGEASSYRITYTPLAKAAAVKCRRVLRHGRRVTVCPKKARKAEAAASRKKRSSKKHRVTKHGPATVTITVKPSGPAGTPERITPPVAVQSVTIQAIDQAGNISVPVTLVRGQRAVKRVSCKRRHRGAKLPRSCTKSKTKKH